MKRAKFFKVIGAAVVLPSLAVKALEEWPEDQVVEKPEIISGEEYFSKHFKKATPKDFNSNKPNLYLIDEAAHWPAPEQQKHRAFWSKIEQKTLFQR